MVTSLESNRFETERMVLRPFADTAGDVDLVLALHGDPEVMRFINGGRPVARAAIVDGALPKLRRRYPGLGRGPGAWAAEEKETGRFLGWFSIPPLDPEDGSAVDLGYRLNRWAWGHGYATEGGRALVELAFTELGVERVVADTMAVNTRSRRVLEKVGLTFVRSFFGEWPETIEGSEYGDVAYELTRADWLRARAGGRGRDSAAG